jgi:protoheme IX farnesyltransferase
MNFRLSSTFSRFVTLVFVAVLFVTLGGLLVARTGAGAACLGWPLCSPHGLPGWIALLHRVGVGIASLLVAALLPVAWREHRDHRVLLPLATLTALLYFAQAFVGALQTTRGLSPLWTALHALTAASLWIGLGALLLASGFLSRESVAFPPLDVRQRARDVFTLTKPLIVALLLVTTFAGLVAGARGWPSPALMFWTLLGGALAAGGSSALNQYIDRDLDKNMQRTARRPLAAGRMTPAEGLAFGLALSVTSFYILVGFVNLLAALLALAGIFYYVLLYSVWLKKATVQNIVIGGGAGAIPPLVGWAAATGRLDMTALFLFAIIFLWTPPHFWALALVRRKDYEHAGVPMLPVVRGTVETRKQVWWYTLALVALTLLLPLLGTTGMVYFGSALLFGGMLIFFAWRVYTRDGNKVAWMMYRYSSMYLAFIFIALVIDAVV